MLPVEQERHVIVRGGKNTECIGPHHHSHKENKRYNLLSKKVPSLTCAFTASAASSFWVNLMENLILSLPSEHG